MVTIRHDRIERDGRTLHRFGIAVGLIERDIPESLILEAASAEARRDVRMLEQLVSVTLMEHTRELSRQVRQKLRQIARAVRAQKG